jgi:hypothetical protein
MVVFTNVLLFVDDFTKAIVGGFFILGDPFSSLKN